MVDTTSRTSLGSAAPPLTVLRRALATTRRALPQGRTLPGGQWRQRHRTLSALLWLHALALPLFGTLRGYGVLHSIFEGMVLVVIGGLALLAGTRPRLASALVSFGLVTSSAILVHFSSGVIEAHFHFFVVLTT